MIDYKKKDQLLKVLINNQGDEVRIVQGKEQLSKDAGISESEVLLLLDYFQSKELIQYQPMSYVAFDIKVAVKAHDLFLQGGFESQSILFSDNMKKLKLELESLENNTLDKTSKVAGIISNITQLLSFVSVS